MTICNPPLLTKAIPVCVNYIEIGDVSPSISVSVYLRDITTKLLMMFQESSNGAGRVVLDISEYDFSDLHAYELWITPANEPIESYLPITVSGTTTPSEIVQVRFMPVIENGQVFSQSIVTLEAA